MSGNTIRLSRVKHFFKHGAESLDYAIGSGTLFVDMNRIREIFGVSRVLLPVIHPLDAERAMANVELAVDAGCKGVFLINQGMSTDEVLELIMAVRARYADLWVGVNLLGKEPTDALRSSLEACAGRIDGIWTDNANIDENEKEQPEAQDFVKTREKLWWKGLYFGGVAFKYQRQVRPEALGHAAIIAQSYMDVICTSGPGTGQAADVEKVKTLRESIGDEGAIALASGVTADNIHEYLPYVDAYLVGTGIEKTFGILDGDKLAELQKQIQDYAFSKPLRRSEAFKNLGEPKSEFGYTNGRQVKYHMVDITASGRELLRSALSIAFSDIVWENQLHHAAYVAEAGKALVFFYEKPRHRLERPWTLRKTPTQITLDQAVEITMEWLSRVDYGPDEHDGSVRKGWHVFNGRAGVVDDVWETFVAVEPSYIYYPK